MINFWDLIISIDKPPIVVVTDILIEEKGIREMIDEAGYLLFVIDGAIIQSNADLFHDISTVLKFPNYFGYNWNALYDCLTDLDWWVPSKGYFLLCKSSDTFINNPLVDIKMFIKVIKDATEFWKLQGIRFGLILEVKRNKDSFQLENL